MENNSAPHPDDPTIKPPAQAAGGVGAISQTLRSALREMGLGRSLKTLAKLNQKDGFDCPSCAWPDPDGQRSVTEFCENGAKAVAAEATRARVTPDFFAKHSVTELAAHEDMWLDQQGRITRPMVLRKGDDKYEPIEWNQAFSLIAGELNSLASPNEASFYTSGRTSNEAAFLFQLFARQFGTNNLPDCSNMCHESSGLGLKESIGIGKGTVKLEDFEAADAIFIIGQNPGTNHPRMLTSLQKAARNGCKIVSVNPLPEAGMMRFKHPREIFHLLGAATPIASLFLPVRINGDVAALKGIMRIMLEEDRRTGGKVLDHDFIRDRTEGFDSFAQDLQAENWQGILSSSGLSMDQLRAAAQIAMNSRRMICCWAMGITQHRNGVANVQTIANFALLRGQIGREGAGLCPVRGHSNVQGDRTMGIWEKMDDRFMEALGREFDFVPPALEGYDTVNTIKAMREGRIKLFFGMGGNFLGASPDTELTAAALRQCRLTVHVSTKLNRSHLTTGSQALILPCLGRTERDARNGIEQFVSVEDSMGNVHRSRGVLEPASDHLLSEVQIVTGLAHATLKGRSKIDWQGLAENYDRIRDHIERVVPGFENYNSRVRKDGGFYLPNGPREGHFPTPSGRARFIAHPIPILEMRSGELLLTTIRSHDQFNTTIYGHDDRYRGVFGGRRVVFLNAQDLNRRGLRDGQWVDLVSLCDGQERRAKRFKIVAYPIPPGCAAAYFPETNVLVPVQSVAERSNQPASKSVIISIEAATE
jgi:molybdopterin-dependent oxidoreductase alpha subunit